LMMNGILQNQEGIKSPFEKWLFNVISRGCAKSSP
jgi:hypothetical protein